MTDVSRAVFSRHPWILSGGDAPGILQELSQSSFNTLESQIKKRTNITDFGDRSIERTTTEIGFASFTGTDEVFVGSESQFKRLGIDPGLVRRLVAGELVRDWTIATGGIAALVPYDDRQELVKYSSAEHWGVFLWSYRTTLGSVMSFGGKTKKDTGEPWWGWYRWVTERYTSQKSITFAFVATHNHFVLDRGGKAFNRTAPIIQLPEHADEQAHIALLGLLNSSVACFWMKQVLFDRGNGGIGGGISSEEWERRYEHAGTALQDFPLASARPVHLALRIDHAVQQRAAVHPSTLTPRLPFSSAELKQARDKSESLLRQMIALQEELDWWCYRAYGLIEDDLCLKGDPAEIALGERAFEIVMARQMKAGELETTWFERHGSTPITDVPAHWPAAYSQLVQQRIAFIESHPWISLLEKPEYKRRWNQPSWEELEQAALQGWLLDRLETSRYWPDVSLQSLESLVSRVELDADFMSVATLYTGQDGFALRPLLSRLLLEEAVPAVRALRYKDTGLRKRADWEATWEKQRQEDAIDAAVQQEFPRLSDEFDADWEARLRPEQTRRKKEAIGDIPAPPKYTGADFVTPVIKKLRGDLDVPKERFFSLPKSDGSGEWLYGWAGWNHSQRVQAIASTYIQSDGELGWSREQLIPLLAAVHEELPWVLQWHNQIDPDSGARLGDYFQSWLGTELQKHNLTREGLETWRPEKSTRRARKKT